MRIWVHLTLSSLGVLLGFGSGCVLIALVLELIRGYPQWVVIPVIVVTGFAFIFGGVRAGEAFVRLLPARCPHCKGRSFAEGHRPIRFRCTECEHVHQTRMRTNWGND